jgi:hypothetical protein
VEIAKKYEKNAKSRHLVAETAALGDLDNLSCKNEMIEMTNCLRIKNHLMKNAHHEMPKIAKHHLAQLQPAHSSVMFRHLQVKHHHGNFNSSLS